MMARPMDPRAPQSCLDHALTCKHGHDVVIHHNRLRDVFAESCRRRAHVEVGCGFRAEQHHTSPADDVVANWMMGKPAQCILTFAVTFPLISCNLPEVSVTAVLAALICSS